MNIGILLIILMILTLSPFLLKEFIKHPPKLAKLLDVIFKPKSTGPPHKPRIRWRR